jgi:hypothetical protein
MDSFNQALSAGLQTGLRMQELRSQQAYRQMQERQLAQEMSIRLQQHEMMIDAQADRAKAAAAFEADLMLNPPLIPVRSPGAPAIRDPGMAPMIGADGNPVIGDEGMAPMIVPDQESFVPNPNAAPIEDLVVKHFAPVEMKWNPRGATDVLADAARMRQAREQAQHQPGFETHTDSRTGRQYSVFRNSRNSAQLVHQPEEIEFTDPNTGKPVGAIQQGNTTKFMPQQGVIAKRMGATAANEEAKKAPHLAIQNPNAPEGFLMIDPARRGEFEAQSQLTPADRSDLTQRITKLTDTAQRLNPLIENADKIFGPKALAGTVVVDRVLANFNPKLAVGQRIQGREAARFAIEGLIRSMNEGQGAPSDQDRKRIEALFPELGNVEELLDNPTRASEIFRGLQKELARDAVVNAHMMGQKPPREAWQHASPAFLLEQLKSKRIDRETFIDVIDNNVHKNEVQAVLNSLN